jgi:hypothetical protein
MTQVDRVQNPSALRGRPLDAPTGGQDGTPRSTEPRPPVVVRRPPSARVSAADMAAMRAEYLKAEAERRAKGYRFVCPTCTHAHAQGERHEAA